MKIQSFYTHKVFWLTRIPRKQQFGSDHWYSFAYWKPLFLREGCPKKRQLKIQNCRLHISTGVTESGALTYREPARAEPVEAPNVEMATKTGVIQATGPR